MPLMVCVYIVFFTDFPVQVGCHLVMPMDVFYLGEFRAARDGVINSLLTSIVEAVMWFLSHMHLLLFNGGMY